MTATPEIRIAGRSIGVDHPPYIIAELSANHLQEYARALEVLEMAAAQGADAVKLQTYRPDTITIDHDSPQFRISGGLWDGQTLYQLYESAYMPWEWHEPLMKRGAELGVHVFSSPFDDTAIDLLRSLNAPAYKIASFEASWPVLAAIKWHRQYHAMLATPLRIRDVILGHQAYFVFRLLLTGTVYFVVITAFGAVESPLGVLAGTGRSGG